MSTLREHFEKDFSTYTRVHILFPFKDHQIEGALLIDFASYSSFIALFFEEYAQDLNVYKEVLSTASWGATQLSLDGRVTLPSARTFPGQMRIEQKPRFEIKAKYYGENEWIRSTDIPGTKRIFIYTDADFSSEEVAELRAHAIECGHELQIRDKKYIDERTRLEHPLAFISHDARDKEPVAYRIAVGLQRMLCPVWYDDFSLKVGDNLRDSIEKGLKECRKCILVLSPRYFSNTGWTKKEFDSIFTRELIEEKNLILPVWYEVTKKDVFEYSPSLSNVVALDWDKLGENEVIRRLYNEIM